MTELYELDVSQASAAIAAGRLSVLELNTAIIAHLEILEPSVSAFACLDKDGWLAAAAELDAEARAGKLRSTLHGIPAGIKDQFQVQGLPCAVANSWGRTGVSESDAAAVAKARAAGAIITGTTFMPDRVGWPPTRNPWNLDYSPGGSSSGSAAAVGGRLVPFALGESTGGSGIRPPAFCGVDALKPTPGRISCEGLYPISWSLDTPTIIARSFTDLALIYHVLADDGGPGSSPAPVTPACAVDLRPPRIGFVRNYFPDRATEVMNEAVESAARKLAAAGADVTDVYLCDGFEAVWPAWEITVAAERAAFHAQHAASLPDLEPSAGSVIPAAFYLHAQRVRRLAAQLALSSLANVEVLYTPAAAGPAPQGQGGGSNAMNSPWSAVGLPAATFSIGLDPGTGLPLGAQIVAGHFGEETLLRVGWWCEGVLGRLSAPPTASPQEGGRRCVSGRS